MEAKFFVNSNDNSKCLQFTEITGNINYKFDFSKTVHLVRIIGTKEGHYNRYNRIKIGKKEFTIADGIAYYNPPSADTYDCKDFLFESDFYKGDDFIVEHDNCIKSLILFIK